MTLLEAIATRQRDALNSMLAEDVVFHSPVQTYRGREQVIHLLMTMGGVIEDVDVTRELDGITFFAAQIEEHPVDGVLVEEGGRGGGGDAGEGGEIAQITLMLRPLAQLQAAVARMARALAEPG
jgi:SnoaL-like domain